MTFTRGLDVSWCQSEIRWELVPPEFRYVFMKCAEGETGLDPNRQRNLDGATRSGRYALAYLFFRSSQNAVAQAENMWRAVGPTMPLLVMLDFESLAKNLSAREGCERASLCVRELRARFGRHPTLYLFPYFEQHDLADVVHEYRDLTACPLTMADYRGGEMPPEGWKPFVPRGWPTWTFAQTSGNNSSIVPGIPGHVDHDIFNGDEDALRDFLGLPPPGAGEREPAIVHPPIDFPPREPPTDE